MMENQTVSTKSDPIIIEQPGMRMTVEHRHGLGGADEGLTFDVTTEGEGKRILRFDCFYKNPHYHIGPSGGESAAYKMKDEGIEDSVRWTLDAAEDSLSRDGQTSRIRGNRQENRPASRCRSAHPVRSGNTREILIGADRALDVREQRGEKGEIRVRCSQDLEQQSLTELSPKPE